MNPIITSSIELAELTGSFYASNNFKKVENDVLLECETIRKLVGSEVYDRAADIYVASESSDKPGTIKEEAIEIDRLLLQHIQMPVALGAAFSFMQSNLVSHDDTTRKVKLDKDSETMPWQWMIDADNEAHLQKKRIVTDRLIDFLDNHEDEIEEWKNSEAKQAAKELFLPNTSTFQDYFPIDQSALFYYSVKPFITTIQRTKIKRALGADFDGLLSRFKTGQTAPNDTEILTLTQEALALLTMVTAFKRMSIQYMPTGVVQQFLSERQNMSASTPPNTTDLHRFTAKLEHDANEALDQIRVLRYKNDEQAISPVLIPKNSSTKKYART